MLDPWWTMTLRLRIVANWQACRIDLRISRFTVRPCKRLHCEMLYVHVLHRARTGFLTTRSPPGNRVERDQRTARLWGGSVNGLSESPICLTGRHGETPTLLPVAFAQHYVVPQIRSLPL